MPFSNPGIKDDILVEIDLVFSSVNNFNPKEDSILSEKILSPCITSCWLFINELIFGDTILMEKYTGIEMIIKDPRMNKNAVKIMIDSNDDAEDIQIKKN